MRGQPQSGSSKSERGQRSPTISLTPISTSRCSPGFVDPHTWFPLTWLSSPLGSDRAPFWCAVCASLHSPCRPPWSLTALPGCLLRALVPVTAPSGVAAPFLPSPHFLILQDPTQSPFWKVFLSISELAEPDCPGPSLYILLSPFPAFFPSPLWLARMAVIVKRRFGNFNGGLKSQWLKPEEN